MCVPFSSPYLLSSAACNMEAVRRTPILEVGISAVESTLSSNNTRTGELDSPLLSKNSKVDVARAAGVNQTSSSFRRGFN